MGFTVGCDRSLWQGRRRTVSGLIATVALVSAVTGCSQTPEEPSEPPTDITYQSDSSLLTVNAQSTLGLATGADEIAARIYPGPFISGADHQTIPNADVATAEPNLAEHTIAYTINADAVFSDGQPITCEDFFLSWTAAEYRRLFHTAPSVMNIIERFDCAAQSKTFTIKVEDGAAERFRQFFVSGTVMPSHIVAAQAGVDDILLVLDRAQQFRANTAQDVTNIDGEVIRSSLPGLADVADAWASSFILTNDNLPNLVTSGPYIVDDITPGAQPDTVEKVRLVANPRWWGDAPQTSPIEIYSYTAQLSGQVDRDTMLVASTKSGAIATQDEATSSQAQQPSTSRTSSSPSPTPAPKDAATADADTSDSAPVPAERQLTLGGKDFRYTQLSGGKITSLVPARDGVMESGEARRALNGCLDRTALARIVSDYSGQEVSGTALHMTPPSAPLSRSLKDIDDANSALRIEESAKLLGGQTIRLGYNDVIAVHADMAKEIQSSCKKADIDVEISHSRTMNQAELGDTIDLFLTDVDPAIAYPSVRDGDEALTIRRGAENELWIHIPTIPLVPVAKNVLWSPLLTNVVPSCSWGGVGWNLDRWAKETNE